MDLYWAVSYFIAQSSPFETVRLLFFLKLNDGRPAAGEDLRNSAVVGGRQVGEGGADLLPAAVGGVGQVGDLQLIIDLTTIQTVTLASHWRHTANTDLR